MMRLPSRIIETCRKTARDRVSARA